jgi:hypothetical protein
MNINRLSTNLNNIGIPLDLDERIKNLINAPLNLERLQNGKIFIKSTGVCLRPGRSIQINVMDNNGLIINSFSTIKDCALFFNMRKTTFCRKLDKGDPILFKNESFFVKRVYKNDDI